MSQEPLLSTLRLMIATVNQKSINVAYFTARVQQTLSSRADVVRLPIDSLTSGLLADKQTKSLTA